MTCKEALKKIREGKTVKSEDVVHKLYDKDRIENQHSDSYTSYVDFNIWVYLNRDNKFEEI